MGSFTSANLRRCARYFKAWTLLIMLSFSLALKHMIHQPLLLGKVVAYSLGRTSGKSSPFSPWCRAYWHVRLATHMRTLYSRRFCELRKLLNDMLKPFSEIKKVVWIQTLVLILIAFLLKLRVIYGAVVSCMYIIKWINFFFFLQTSNVIEQERQANLVCMLQILLQCLEDSYEVLFWEDTQSHSICFYSVSINCFSLFSASMPMNAQSINMGRDFNQFTIKGMIVGTQHVKVSKRHAKIINWKWYPRMKNLMPATCWQ